MSETAVFDLEEALARVGGDRALLVELLALAEADFPLMLSRLRAAAAAGDRPRIRAEAHALKGVLGNLSARRAFGIAGKIEQDAHAGIARTIEPEITLLAEEIAAFIAAFRRAVG
jgi:HPt (histidine-containing phosphotransfer) domain-containing protein